MRASRSLTELFGIPANCAAASNGNGCQLSPAFSVREWRVPANNDGGRNCTLETDRTKQSKGDGSLSPFAETPKGHAELVCNRIDSAKFDKTVTDKYAHDTYTHTNLRKKLQYSIRVNLKNKSASYVLPPVSLLRI